MRNSINKLTILCIVLFLFNSCNFQYSIEKNRRSIIGCYVIDTSKTYLTQKDKINLSTLELAFYPDSTFSISIDTPYFYDTVGYWLSGTDDAYDYNKMYFGTINKKYEDINFYSPYVENKDTIFLMSGTMPKQNQKGLGKIFFKKISCASTPKTTKR